MPDSLDGVLTLLRNVGPGPLLGAAGVLILLRVATPEALRGAMQFRTSTTSRKERSR